jgi:RNA polymerase sigma-70 factor (TIGR02957 family)
MAKMSEELRPLLFSIAYRMLGSVGDAEDVVQEAFLRAERAQADGTEIASSRAFLTTVTTRLAIDELRSARARRETYVGPWLPEPLLTSTEPDAAEHAEMADSLSMSFLLLLETLSPSERAVFLLREVFEYGYDEIAEIVGKSEANCRQILARARKRIDEGKPRFEADRRQQEELARRFLGAFEEGDVDGLVELLAADVVFVGDGGGKGRGISRPVYGQQGVTRMLVSFVPRYRAAGAKVRLGEVNGQPGALFFDADERLVNVFAFEIAEGAIQAVRSVINPDKLAHLGYPLSPLARADRRDP